jgi:hypothetical protein
VKALLPAGPCDHPDRPKRARGQCAPCYGRDLRKRNPSIDAKHKEIHAKWMANPENRARHNAQHRSARKLLGPQPHRKHKITAEEYAAFMAQPCGICGEPSSHLDHNHVTGLIRGGLCHRCNISLGHVEGWGQTYSAEIRAWMEKQ